MAERQLTQEYVRSLFDYDPETGVLTWKTRPVSDFVSPGAYKAWNTKYAGKKAGYPQKTGYLTVRINGENALVHRVIWLYLFGEIGDLDIDHADRNRSNNCIENLRLATRSQNIYNTSLSTRNTSGARGVAARCGKWTAKIVQNGRTVHLGTFCTLVEASEAYQAAAKERFGEFATVGT